MSNYIVALVKVTDYPKDLLNKGLYCNRWKYFVDREKNERFDPTETAATFLNTQFKIGNRIYSINLADSDNAYSPVFCMTAIYSKKFIKPPIIKLPNNKLTELGKEAVIITDVKVFIKRLNQQLPAFSYSTVDYIDYASFVGAIKYPITTKDNMYSPQQEFRIYNQSIALTKDVFDVPGKKQIRAEKKLFCLGNITDIAEKCNTDELLDGKRVNLTVDWDFCHKKNIEKR